MFNAKLTIGFSGTKPDVVFEWANLTKVDTVSHLEDRLIKCLVKLNDMSDDVIRGRAPTATATNPIEMTLEFLIEEDGTKWHRSLLEWPKMGDEQQAMLLGLLHGQLATLPGEVKGKGKGKEKGPK